MWRSKEIIPKFRTLKRYTVLFPHQLSRILILEIKWKNGYTKWLGDTESSHQVSWLSPSIFSFSANVFVRFWNYAYSGLIIQSGSVLSFSVFWVCTRVSYLFLKCLIEFTGETIWGPFDNVISLLDISLFKFVSPCIGFSKLYFSRNVSISSKLPKLWFKVIYNIPSLSFKCL